MAWFFQKVGTQSEVLTALNTMAAPADTLEAQQFLTMKQLVNNSLGNPAVDAPAVNVGTLFFDGPIKLVMSGRVTSNSSRTNMTLQVVQVDSANNVTGHPPGLEAEILTVQVVS